MAEKKTRIPGFIGPTNNPRAPRFSCERTINFYLELSATGQGKEQEPAYLMSLPGLRKLQDLGTYPIRCLYTLSSNTGFIVVAGPRVLYLTSSTSTPVELGFIGSMYGKVSIADNGIQGLIVDGQNGYYFNVAEPELLYQVNDPNFYPADVVTYQDGYFILNKKGTNYFFWSDVFSVDFPSLNQAGRSGAPDSLVAAYSFNRQIMLFGTKTTEAWFNSGASGITPFERLDGRFTQVGCVAWGTIAAVHDTLFWLGSNAQGGAIVYQLEGSASVRISTPAIEYALQSLPDLSKAEAFAYQEEGHLFYVLNVDPKTTFAYDVSTKQWTERQSQVNGVHGRYFGQNHCTFNNEHLISDYRNGNLYKLDFQCFTDDNQPRLKLRQAPHLSEELNNLFVDLLEIDAQFGVGLTDDGNNQESDVNPHLVLEVSRDGGMTFGPAMKAPLGKQGKYLTRARFNRLGRGRDFVFRVSCTDSVALTLLGAHISVQVGNG